MQHKIGVCSNVIDEHFVGHRQGLSIRDTHAIFGMALF